MMDFLNGKVQEIPLIMCISSNDASNIEVRYYIAGNEKSWLLPDNNGMLGLLLDLFSLFLTDQLKKRMLQGLLILIRL